MVFLTAVHSYCCIMKLLFRSMFSAPVLAVILMPLVSLASLVKPGRLTCEYLENPLGLDTHTPRFSWTLLSSARNQVQTAYEIVVDEQLNDSKKQKVWASGKITSDQSIHIPYAGKALQSFTRYYWRVRVYDGQGKASAWSAPQWFETALLNTADWRGDWIGDGSKQFTHDEDFYQEDPMPLFRRSFKASKKIASARLYISGLGYYEAYINGAKVGDHVLDPGWTAYDKQILYTVYDITGQVKKGNNTAGIMLGNGWYNMLPLRFWGALNWRDALATGRPKVKAMIRIVYHDGTMDVVETNTSWQTAPGPILRNNIYLGEHVDGRLDNPDWCTDKAPSGGWKNAVVVTGPKGILTAQKQPPIRVTNVLKPVAVAEPAPGTFVFDMGQNFAGVARIKINGPAGTKITLRYGEDKYPDGNVNVMTSVAGQIKGSNGGPGAPPIAWQEDSYILKGGGTEVWAPRFTFHGFRYVEVKGWPGKPTLDDIEGLRMNADLQKNGQFTSSNSMFNKLDEVIQWTFLSNVFSVLSDCPAREKLAYGGDILCTTEAFMFNYDMPDFYAKVIRDHANDQRPLGGITETAPYVGIADAGPGDKSGPLGYQVGFPFMIKKMYDFYGDKRIVEDNYQAVRKHIEFLRSTAKDNLFDTDLGDHESLDEKPIPLTASVFYHLHVTLLKDFAAIVGNSADEAEYARLAGEIRKSIVKAFSHPGTGKFANGTQSAQLFALWSGMADGAGRELVFKELINAFEQKNWHLSTGIFGTKMMFDVFRRADQNDLVYRVANQRDFPGWGHMIGNGATTLWETWKYSDNTFSQNHPMFGSVGEWFYRSLLGINDAAPGFKKIIIKPQPAGDLTHASGSFRSVYGHIGSAWKITDAGFFLDVEIPVNTRAEIWIPNQYGQSITEGGKPAGQVAGLTTVNSTGGYTVLEAGSGRYSFQAAK